MRCWPPSQPSLAVHPGIVTHRSRGIETSAADFVTGSILARIIVSDRVPLIGSSSRLSMPRSRMLTRSVPCQSGSTFFTTLAMLVVRSAGLAGGALGALLTGPGLSVIVTGTLTVTGPAATVTTLGGTPGADGLGCALSARSLATNTTPNAIPPSTNAQKAATVNRGGPEPPAPGALNANETGPCETWTDYRQAPHQVGSTDRFQRHASVTALMASRTISVGT